MDVLHLLIPILLADIAFEVHYIRHKSELRFRGGCGGGESGITSRSDSPFSLLAPSLPLVHNLLSLPNQCLENEAKHKA